MPWHCRQKIRSMAKAFGSISVAGSISGAQYCNKGDRSSSVNVPKPWSVCYHHTKDVEDPEQQVGCDSAVMTGITASRHAGIGALEMSCIGTGLSQHHY